MNITTDNPPTREGSSMDKPNSYWRSPRTIAAAAAVWATTSGGAHHDTTAYGSACGLSGGSTAAPTTAPDVQWQNVDGTWLPVSSTQGPGQRPATGPWSCYAHTPTGAVLAAFGIGARMASAADFSSVVKQQTVPGPGQTALLRQGPGGTPANGPPVPIGFKLNGSVDDTVTITVYVRQSGKNLRCPATVQWIGGDKGDWALRLTPDGGVSPGCEALPTDLRGLDFISWGPNS
jgi:hypothetical protein